MLPWARRGRGASGDTAPYTVEREVEDLEALIAAAGGLAGAGAAGLVTLTKGYEGKRPRTWVHITKLGRDAFQAEVAALKQLVQHFEQLGTDRPQRP